MRILVTGACGFVGSTMISHWLKQDCDYHFIGIDNLQRAGSHINRKKLTRLGVDLHHGDIRMASDLAVLPEVDFVLDAAANPSVLAGLGESGQSRQLVEHNFLGTLNLLEFCRQRKAGLILLSTSRVYNITDLSALPMEVVGESFGLKKESLESRLVTSVSLEGISESFSTKSPVSLYGATKLASEVMALEYAQAFEIPVWINRCGVMAGAGQFARADQGVFGFWLHRWFENKPLKYIGFGGKGYQVRDCLHPADLCDLVNKQLNEPVGSDKPRLVNISGGKKSAMSLAQLSCWCANYFGPMQVEHAHEDRPYDLPWVVLDHTLASNVWGWQPQIQTDEILTQIAEHAKLNPNWLAMTGGN